MQEDTASQRTVVIFPPTGGANRIDRSYAKQVFERGENAIIVTGWTGHDEERLDLEIHPVLHERALKAFQVVLSRIPPEQKVSVLGTSVGGLFAAIIASEFDRPERVLVIAGGAPIPQIVANSDEKTLSRVREQRFEKYGFKNRDEYANALAQKFSLDPLDLSQGFQSKKLGLIIMTEDTTVPTEYQLRLKDHWPNSSVLKVENDHFWGIVNTWWYHSDWVLDFLLK
jgi:pimeloyl-ACP methyl ester carboxylesterase